MKSLKSSIDALLDDYLHTRAYPAWGVARTGSPPRSSSGVRGSQRGGMPGLVSCYAAHPACHDHCVAGCQGWYPAMQPILREGTTLLAGLKLLHDPLGTEAPRTRLAVYTGTMASTSPS